MRVQVFRLCPHAALTQATELHTDWHLRANKRDSVRHNGKAQLLLLILMLRRVLPHVLWSVHRRRSEAHDVSWCRVPI